MTTSLSWSRGGRRAGAATLAVALLASVGSAQYAERGSVHGSGNPDVDVSGRSIKNPRVRAIHTDDPDDALLAGGTAHLINKDPFLAYQLGRNLNFREFRTRDGVFSTVGGLGGPMVDGTTTKITANNHTSCLGCHNQPYGNPGGGPNFAKDSGRGRSSPHYFGAGIVEMLAIQVRADMMSQLDTDADGWVSVSESAAAPNPIQVAPTVDGTPIDYGNPGLTSGTTGSPQLNNIFRVWYGLENPPGTITIVPSATEIDGVNTTHYNFEMVVWGWGQRAPPSALNPTNRAFLWDPLNAHSGLEAYDPTTADDPDGDGVSLPSLSGAIQFPATHLAPDSGTATDALGFSTDDPDGDGYLNEISEGDLDLGEWFMLNAPRPAFAGTAKDYKRGLKIFTKMGCAECHVPDWTIKAADATHPGDRRLFDFDVTWEKVGKKEYRLEGSLVPLYDVVGDTYVRRFGSFEVTGMFTDLKHHDMGSDFAELAYDGNVNTVWRTPPLWGKGSGFPWGHDGASLTLEDVILRHGGEAAASAEKYRKSPRLRRIRLIDFLRRLQLYDVESLPADIDGDDVVSSGFMVAGVDTGTERFNAEWLFSTPGQCQGDVVNTDGDTVRSDAIVNIGAAYGLTLPLRLDSDLDGWPDVWDNDPFTAGFKDGVNN